MFLVSEHATQDTDCLRTASVPIIEPQECKNMYEDYENVKIVDGMMCAGFKQGVTDACDSDSGGPLTCQSSDGRHVVHGIVSWGDRCGQKNRPGVYTNVKDYLPWIEETILSF